jgi:hypothetical protein
MKRLLTIFIFAAMAACLAACAAPASESISDVQSMKETAATKNDVLEEAAINNEEFIVQESEPLLESYHFESKGLEVIISDIATGISERREEPFIIVTVAVKNNNSNPWKANLVSSYLELENGLKSDGAGFNGDTDLKFLNSEVEANAVRSAPVAWHFKDIESIEPGIAKVIKFDFTEIVPEEEKDGPFLNTAKFEDIYFEFR